MNSTYRSIWRTGAVVAASGSTRGASKQTVRAGASVTSFAIHALTGSLLLAIAAAAQATPVGGVVTAGQATINPGANTVITQTTSNVAINWQSFGIGTGQTVQFVQPGVNSVALNRVLGADPSVILGSLSSNGKVFLLNPNGILFGSGSSVNVGGLVASTMNITDANFMAGNYAFANAGNGSIINQGTINATEGGYVALMGRNVSNQGVISARLGSVALAAGEAVTLDVAGDGMLNVSVSQGAVNALVENGGLIRADGGQVLLTAQAAGSLLHTVVNNTGVIQAQTIGNRNGTILLLGDMQTGSVNVGGTLDASAPNGGDGGFVETSAAHVNVRDGARVTTAASQGRTGHWLIDPMDYIIGTAPGSNISGATLQDNLTRTSITINTDVPGNGNGDIFVNDAVTWTPTNHTTLFLIANRDVNINAAITATNGSLSVCCGQDVNVNAAISVTNGSVLLAAGRNVNQKGAITVIDGNLMMCAANNVNIFSKITLKYGVGANDPVRNLGLPQGLTLSADTDGTGPGIAGGTVVIDSLAPPITVVGAPVSIYYNPISYAASDRTVYRPSFDLTEGAALSQYMLVFAAGGDKTEDGTTTTTLTGLKGNPAGVTLVAGAGSRADYASTTPGINKPITFTGYTLAGTDAGLYALPVNCCGPVVAHTTGTILAPVTPPPVTPPPVTPPPVTPPGATPPPPGNPIFGVPPPLPPLPPPPGTLVVVPPVSPPTLTVLVVQPPSEEVPPPYVAPVRKPKPYRN